MWASRTAGVETNSVICLPFLRHHSPRFLCRRFCFVIDAEGFLSSFSLTAQSLCARACARA